MRRGLFAAVLALAGLSAPVAASPLSGRPFEAAFLGGAAVVGDKAPTFLIEDARVSGTGGCNQYGATAQDRGRFLPQKRGRTFRRIAAGGLRIGSISATRMYCGPGSAQEARFFDLLGKTRAYRMGRSELRLLSGGRRPRVLMVLRAAD